MSTANNQEIQQPADLELQNNASKQDLEKVEVIPIGKAEIFAKWLAEGWLLMNVDPIKAKERLHHALALYFDNSSNPFIAFLDLTEILLSTQQVPLYRTVWYRFLAWQQAKVPRGKPSLPEQLNWTSVFGGFLSSEILRRAAALAIETDLTNFSIAHAIFRFDDHPNDAVSDIFACKVKKLLAQKNFRGAVTILERQITAVPPSCLYDEEILKKLSLFLLCKGKVGVVVKLLKEIAQFERVHDVLLYLDYITSIDFQERASTIRSELNVDANFKIWLSDVEGCCIQLIRGINVALDAYRNIRFADLRKKTGFLVSSTFGADAEMDVETFRELVDSFAQADERYSRFVLKVLFKSGNLDEVYYMATAYGLVEDLNLLQSQPLVNPAAPKTTYAKGKKRRQAESDVFPFYELPPSIPVFVVETLFDYRKVMECIISLPRENDNMCKCIGVDAEWPCITPSGCSGDVAILQLALIDKIFILDLLKLSATMTAGDWLLLKIMFKSPQLVKIAFGFASDVTMLKQSFPFVLNDLELVNMVDLELLVPRLCKKLSKDDHELASCSVAESSTCPSLKKPPKSLVGASQAFLGRTISKMFRKSNWNRRPLCDGQLLYAAIDSYCMLDIYREILSLSTSQGIDLDQLATAAENPDEAAVAAESVEEKSPGDVLLDLETS